MRKLVAILMVLLFLSLVFAGDIYDYTRSVMRLVVVDSVRVGGSLGATSSTGTYIWKIVKDTDLLIITATDTFVVDSVRAK